MNTRNQVLLTELDALRLRTIARQLISQRGDSRSYGEGLFDLLDTADVVPAYAITPDVVTMNSKVIYADSEDDPPKTLTLVYPENGDINDGRVSVLSPLGARLIGARAGERISFTTPGSGVRSIQVRRVLYQPEAHGDWDL